MAAISTYLANKIFDHVLKNTAYTPPAKVYLALYTADPTAAGTGTEVSGGSYARQEITFDAASSQATQNTAAVEFPKATANWGAITHWGIKDASTAGNLLYFGALTTAVTINTNNYFKTEAGDLDLSVT